MRKIKFLLSLAFLMICFALPAPVFAEEEEAAPNGSITVTLAQPDTPQASVQGVVFGLVQVGSFDKETQKFSLTGPYQDLKIDINALTQPDAKPEAVQQAADLLEDNIRADAGTKGTTDANGSVTFSGLPDGVYLIYPINDDNYDIMQAILVWLPRYDEVTKKEVNSVTVTPKHDKRPEETPTPPTKPTPTPTPPAQKPTPTPEKPVQKPVQTPTQKPVQNVTQNPSSPTVTTRPTNTAAETQVRLWIVAAVVSLLLLCLLALRQSCKRKYNRIE